MRSSAVDPGFHCVRAYIRPCVRLCVLRPVLRSALRPALRPAWWNFAFLFTITVMPFTSDLLGKFSANPLAIDIFAANLLLATMATQLTVIYGSRKDLVTPETAQQTRAARYRVAGSVLVIVASIVLAWVNPDAAKYCWLLLAVVPRFAERLSGRQTA